MKASATICDACGFKQIFEAAPHRRRFEGGLPDGWVSLHVERGGERLDPVKRLGLKMGKALEALEGQGPEAMGEAIGVMARDLAMAEQPDDGQCWGFEFCPECVQQLVVTMKGHPLIPDAPAREDTPR
jgi:hypothetical protein